MSLVSVLQKAATRFIRLAGSVLTYQRAASTTSVRAFVDVLSAAEKYQWFTSTETASWDAPAYRVTIAGDFLPFGSEPMTSDTVLLTNHTGVAVPYDVKRWNKQRVGGTVIKTILFVEKH